MLLKQEEKREDPRITRTRQLLHQALLKLMVEKSFEAITIQDTADRATVNRVTFYSHFQDKDALLEYSIQEMFKERLRKQLAEGDPFTSKNLATLIRAVGEFLGEMYRACPAPHGQMDSLIVRFFSFSLAAELEVCLMDAAVVEHDGEGAATVGPAFVGLPDVGVLVRVGVVGEAAGTGRYCLFNGAGWRTAVTGYAG